MQYEMNSDRYLLSFARGESFVETLTHFCTERAIKNATFSGIGAVDRLECGYYNLSEQRYYFTVYEEPLEVVSLTGNVSLKDSVPFVHVHGVCTNVRNEAFGGHIVEMRVAVVLEVALTVWSTTASRSRDPQLGLATLALPHSCHFLTK